MKIWLVICFLILFIASKSQIDSGFSSAECSKVIGALKESLKNDSLVVDYFFRNYIILNWKEAYLKNTASPSTIIKYFQKDENKKIVCVHKRFDQNKVLLMDSASTPR